MKTLGIEVHTTTKARGHQGFYRTGRIDISKNLPENRIIPTLLHEFTHYIHAQIEPEMLKTGGSFEKIFDGENYFYEKELTRVTQFVDENSRLTKLYRLRDAVREKIDRQEEIILEYFPEFQRSKPLKQIEKIVKKTNAKYLLSYDRVKILNFFGRNNAKMLSIEWLERDFPEFDRGICAYIRFKSLQRRQTRLSSRINRYKKYYSKPCEMFARLVEGLYLDEEWVCALAPHTTERFFELLQCGYYKELKIVLNRCTC